MGDMRRVDVLVADRPLRTLGSRWYADLVDGLDGLDGLDITELTIAALIARLED